MARAGVRAALVVGAIGALVVVLTRGDDPAAEPPAKPKSAQRERAAPDEAAIAARKRRALRDFAARASKPTRTLKVRVVDCGLVPGAHASVSVLADGEVVGGLADDVGVFRAPIDQEATDVSVTVELEVPGALRRGVAAAAPGAADLDVDVCPGASVSGVVRDERGRPLGEAIVRFGDDQDVAVTESDGEFMLTDQYLTADRIVVEHSLGGAEIALAPVLAAGETRALDIVVESGRRVVGVVVDPWGAAVANVPVVALDAAGAVVARATADRDGRFWLKKLPADTARVRAEGGSRGIGEAPLTARAATEADPLIVRLANDRGTLTVFWEGSEAGTLAATAAGLGDNADPTPREEIALVSGAPIVAYAPAFYRVVVRTAHGEDACGEGLLLPNHQLELRCGRPRDAILTAMLISPNGARAAGVAWAVRIEVPGQHHVTLGGVSDASGVIRVMASLDRAATARLEVGRPDSHIDPLGRRNVVMVPGSTTDLGRLQLRDNETVASMFTERETGSFGGLGAQLRTDDIGVAFSRIVRDGPLDRAGVRAGDVVLDIDGEPAGQLTEREVMLRLRGEPGSNVDLRLLRPGEGELQIELDRAIIDVRNSGWVD